MWQVSIFYKMKNLNHVMSFYMRVGTDWDGIWYKEDRSLLLLLWHRHRLMGWSKVSKPACVHFLTTSLCIPFEFIACVYIWYVFVYVYVYLCICVQIFDCDFSMYVFLSLVLGFIVQAGYSFHMCRNAPGLSYWKWFWFCFFVPLIVKTVMSIFDFHWIFRICDGLHWLRLVLLVIPHPLESELK